MTVDLMDHEVLEAAKILEELTQKYQYKKATGDQLIGMAEEAATKFEAIGLRVQVDVLTTPPTIEIVDRITQYDHERQSAEVRKGLADKFYK